MKRTGRKQRGQERGKQRRRKEAISGFSTLNQVAGVSRPKPHHSSLPVEEPKSIVEPHPVCQYCGTEIDTIASSLSTPERSAMDTRRAVASDWEGQPPARPVLVKTSQMPCSS